MTDYPEISDQERADMAVHNLLRVAARVLRDGLEKHRAALSDAVDEVEPLYESQDPRDMGWVGDDGRP